MFALRSGFKNVVRSRCFAYRNAAQSIPSLTYTKVQLNIIEYDGMSEFDNVTNYRFTVLHSGYYLLSGHVVYDNASDINAMALIYLNGTSIIQGNHRRNAAGTSGINVYCTTMIYLSAGDYIELWTYQSTAGALTTIAGRQYNGLLVQRVG